MFLDSFHWLPGEEENFKFLNAYVALSKKDKLCSWDVLSVKPSGSQPGDRFALHRGSSHPWVGDLDLEVDLPFSAEACSSVPGYFPACSSSCGPRSSCSSSLSLPVHSLSLAGLSWVLLRNDRQASRQQPLNWSCWPSSHLCKSDGL